MYDARRADQGKRRRARRARVARQRQAARRREGRRGRLGRPPALLRRLADQDRGRDDPGLGAATCSVYTLREPVGVCAQIIPWNFPLLMAAWKIAPALAAGCTIVLKPAEQTPLTALRLGELALEAGFPEGASTCSPATARPAPRSSTTPASTRSPSPARPRSGREIGAKCGRSLKRVTLELGGKSPNIILPDADLERRGQGLLPGHLLQLRPGLQRRLAPVRPGRAVRRGRRAAGRVRARRRRSARASTPDSEFGPAGLRGAVRAGSPATSTPASRRAPSWSPAASPRTATAATSSSRPCSRRHGRDDDRPRGDLRPGAGRACRSRTSRRSRGAPTTPSTAWPPASGPATSHKAHKLAALLQGRHRLHQHLGRRRPGGARSAATRRRGSAARRATHNLDAYLETKTVFTQL